MKNFNENITLHPSRVLQLWRKCHKRSLIWILITVLVFIFLHLVPNHFWEQWYYQRFFPILRSSYDFLLGWSPIPMIYIVISILLVRTARWIGAMDKGLVFQTTNAIGGVAALITIFYVGWGFNYGQRSIQERLNFNFKQITQEDIHREFLRATAALKLEAESLPAHLSNDQTLSSLKVVDHDLRPEVELALSQVGLPHQGRVRVRQLWPNGFLLRWSTAGIYIPQAGEGHIDKGLLSVQKPFTIAHEMAHGYGVTDEGACNFIAWLACSQSGDQWVKFGGALSYWRYVAAEMPQDSIVGVLKTLPPIVSRALVLIKANNKKYPDIMPQVRDAVYSTYLKRHGVKGGLRSYNEVVMMVQQYLESKSTHLRTE